jgi:opacity protein-like surface antigen
MKLLLKYAVCLALVWSLHVLAANAQEVYGAPAAAMANTMVTDTNVWATTNNPAGMPWLTKGGIGVGYRNAFAIENLGTKSIATVLPFGHSAFGLSMHSFGYASYSNSRIGVSYGLRLGEKLSMGVQAQFHSLVLEEVYGKVNYFTIGLGVRYVASKNLIFGVHLNNPNQARVAEYNSERSPSRIAAGMSYTWSPRLRMTAEMQQVSNQKGGIRAGLEYAPVSSIVVRCGGGTGPTLFSFGFGWKVKYIDLDVSTHYHDVLGFSPQISLTWVRGRK